MSVGVIKDYKLKLWKLHDSHTLGCPWNWKLTIEKFASAMGEYVTER